MTRHLRRLFPLFAGILMVSLAACVSVAPLSPAPTTSLFPTATAGVPVTGTSLANTQWTLVSFTEAGTATPALPGRALTLEFDANGGVAGSGGCNSFGGQYQVQGSTIAFQQLIHTEMACVEQGLNEQEQKYLGALGSAARFEQSGDSLKIWYGSGQDFLTFSRGETSTPTVAVPTDTVAAPATANPSPTTASSGSAGSPQRITFAPGATTATVSGHLEAFEDRPYVIYALAGQTMTVNLTFTSGEAILIIWGADGNVLMSDHATASSYEGVLPTTEDYNIHVRNRPDGPTDYTMTVSIPPLASGSSPQRITFAPGATTAMVTGHLEASETDPYVIRALAGQTMTINLTFTSGEAILIVWGADGDVLMSDHAGASSFQGVLRTTQDYNIHVRNRPDGPTDYTMTVSIPPVASGEQRIQFAAGATSATVTGQLQASDSDQYVVNAAAGQTMSLNLSFSQGAAILVVWGQDGNVLLSDHAEASSFQMALPTTQDYHIQVHGRPDGPTTYTMTVTIPPKP